MADRGGLHEINSNQRSKENSSNFPSHYLSMGYVADFQLFSTQLTNENPGAIAVASGVKSVLEVSQLPQNLITPGPIIQTHWGVVA